MRYAVVLLMVFAMFSLASVRSGSRHYSDALLFDEYLEVMGIYEEVSIEFSPHTDDLNYIIWLDGDYFDTSSSDDAEEIMWGALAAGNVSRETSWPSAALVLVYEDDLVGLSTYACREVVRMAEEGYYDSAINRFIVSNLVIGDRAESLWPAP